MKPKGQQTITQKTSHFVPAVKVFEEYDAEKRMENIIHLIFDMEPKKIIFVTKNLSDISYLRKEARKRKAYDRIHIMNAERITKKGKSKKFGSSLNSRIIKAIENKESFACTFNSYSSLTKEQLKALRTYDYTLIMNDIPVFYTPQKSSWEKIGTYYRYAKPNKKGVVRWYDFSSLSEENEKYREELKDKDFIITPNRKLIDFTSLFSFYNFRKIYIFSVHFAGEPIKSFFDMNGIKYSYYQVIYKSKIYKLKKTIEKTAADYNLSIKILEKDSFNNIGDNFYSLSNSWYKDNHSCAALAQVRRNIYRFFRKEMNTSAANAYWTCFPSNILYLTPNGYRTSYVFYTNCHKKGNADKTAAAFPINVFPPRGLQMFFVEHGFKISEEDYAINILLKFLSNSAIASGSPVTLYLPSKRMRTIFVDWLKTSNKSL